MCANNTTNNHHDIYFRDKVPPNRSAVVCDIEDREFAFGLLDTIKLDTPEVRHNARNLWNHGIYDPFSHRREKFRGQGQFPRRLGKQDKMDYNL